jgi:hypothetical protein
LLNLLMEVLRWLLGLFCLATESNSISFAEASKPAA